MSRSFRQPKMRNRNHHGGEDSGGIQPHHTVGNSGHRPGGIEEIPHPTSLEKAAPLNGRSPQIPSGSPTRRTEISVRMGFFTISTDMLQILSGELQSEQTPVSVQGVLRPSRLAFVGAATFQTLCRASSISLTILLMPQTTMVFLGPKNIAPTLLPVASTLYNWPCSVMALVLQRK